MSCLLYLVSSTAIVLCHGLTYRRVHQYFSSLERLRIVQDGVSGLSQCSSSCSSTSIRARAQVVSTDLDQRLNCAISSSRNRLRKSPTIQVPQIIPSTPANSAWFMSLSPTLRRKIFTLQERANLSNRADTVVLDAADETIYRRGCHKSSIQPLIYRPHTQSAARADSLEQESMYDSAISMSDHAFEGFRWLEDDDELDLQLDDYHTAIAETAQRQAGINQQDAGPSDALFLCQVCVDHHFHQ